MQVKLAVWQVTEGAAAAPANHSGSQASYSRLIQTPSGISHPGTPGSGPSSVKRYVCSLLVIYTVSSKTKVDNTLCRILSK